MTRKNGRGTVRRRAVVEDSTMPSKSRTGCWWLTKAKGGDKQADLE
jgi:hypothetical protein